jgi:hypothetical protein
VAGDDEREGIGRQGSADRAGRARRADPRSEPGIAGDPAARNPGFGEQDPALERRAPVEGEQAKVESDRFAAQEAGEVGGEAGGGRGWRSEDGGMRREDGGIGQQDTEDAEARPVLPQQRDRAKPGANQQAVDQDSSGCQP